MSAPKDKRNLPVINDHAAKSSINADGTRASIVVAEVRGRFIRSRRIVFALLIGLWIALPLLQVRGNPAVFLDVQHRRFFLFGLSFNAQDVWLLFFVATAFAFSLVVVTALLGRVWCGWACPQTVFLEGIFRPLERLFLGSSDHRRKEDRTGWSPLRVLRTGGLYLTYAGAAIGVAHIFIGYFVSVPKLLSMMRASPSDHAEAFGWMLALSTIFFINFVWFREQFCLVVCPYGRLQSILFDDHSLVVGYEEKRGEPRGKAGKTTGDCVDCGRCVAVCPTGIDIRNGLQIDCIACTQCIDACDEVMDKMGRPKGLIRYDSLAGLRGDPRKIWRPRLWVYGALGVLGLVVATITVQRYEPFEANLLRLAKIPYTREGGIVRNSFEIHLVNKNQNPVVFEIETGSNAKYILSSKRVELNGHENRRVPVFVEIEESKFVSTDMAELRVRGTGTGFAPFEKPLRSPLLGASK
ncbi:MAG: cytochrome c oxidase accessory protein CcoG [Polyangiaceae bacterium]|nr:cytochrome c oxidase accessory protein CcoG [Polyangiaceae bacterium]